MDLLTQEKLRNLVIENLSPFGKLKGDSISILCPWHSESKPSLNVHIGHEIIPGSFRCFGCDAHGNWNKLAKALNLPTFNFRPENKGLANISDREISTIINNLKKSLEVPEPKKLKGVEDLPHNFTWRGYSKKYYELFNAKFYWNRDFDRSYLYFPLQMNGTYLGYTICNLDGRDNNKYQIFADAYKILFLYDYIPCNEPIVIVEGHFDALRLFAEGFFPVGIFGIKNWSAIKKEYIVAKCPPKIVIAFDGDQAGYEAAKDVYRDLRLGCNVDIFYLPYYPANNKLDPGNMPTEFLNQLRQMVDS